MDAGIWDAGAVLIAALLGLGGSRIVVKQARDAQRSAELDTVREREQRENAEQRKLDQSAFDRFERHNQQMIDQLTRELGKCQELTGAAIGYSQALHTHMLVLHEELSKNHIPVPAAPPVPDQLARIPWIPWGRNGATPNDAMGS